MQIPKRTSLRFGSECRRLKLDLVLPLIFKIMLILRRLTLFLDQERREEIDKALKYAHQKSREVNIAVEAFAKTIFLKEEPNGQLPSTNTLLSNIDWKQSSSCILYFHCLNNLHDL